MAWATCLFLGCPGLNQWFSLKGCSASLKSVSGVWQFCDLSFATSHLNVKSVEDGAFSLHTCRKDLLKISVTEWPACYIGHATSTSAVPTNLLPPQGFTNLSSGCSSGSPESSQVLALDRARRSKTSHPVVCFLTWWRGALRRRT